jgi:pimeloyl-ACP methyl ester carboxylesterase
MIPQRYGEQPHCLAWAVDLTPDARDRAMRLFAAAQAHLVAGDGALAEALLDGAASGLAAAGMRAAAQRLRASIAVFFSRHKEAYESIKAFSETDFTEDLKKFDVPILVLHGEDDQIVPVKDAAVKSAQLIMDAKEIYYPGAPHGLTDTHTDQFNADLLAFLRS